jgi:Asparaginase
LEKEQLKYYFLGLSKDGDIAGITTTSGLAWKIPGRIGRFSYNLEQVFMLTMKLEL